MPNLTNINDDNYRMRALFKGEPSTGKSIALASMPEPIYVFDLDGRMRSVANYYRGIKKDLTYDTFRRDQLQLFADKIDTFMNRCPYATVGMDSLTFLSDMILADMLQQRGVSGGKTEQGKGKKVGRFNVPGLEDFGGESAILTQVITALLSLSCHVVLTAHVVTDPISKTSKRKLLTGGSKIAAKIPGYFDEKYHFTVMPDFNPDKPPVFTLITSATGDDWAGTALNIPREISITHIGRYGNPGLYDYLMLLNEYGIEHPEQNQQATLIIKNNEQENKNASD